MIANNMESLISFCVYRFSLSLFVGILNLCFVGTKEFYLWVGEESNVIEPKKIIPTWGPTFTQDSFSPPPHTFYAKETEFFFFFFLGFDLPLVLLQSPKSYALFFLLSPLVIMIILFILSFFFGG